MARPGSTYLAYFWGSKSTTDVRIQLTPGMYSFKGYDARDVGVLATGSVAGGHANVPVPPPSSWDENAGLALLIRR